MTQMEALAEATRRAHDTKQIWIVYLDGEWGITEYETDWLKHMYEKNVFYVLPKGEVTQIRGCYDYRQRKPRHAREAN